MRALALATLCLLVAPASASASPAWAPPPPPSDLAVNGGQETWRPSRSFNVLWTNPATDVPIVAVHYRVLDPGGAVVVGPVRVPWAANRIDSLQVPPLPAAYTVEVSLEDAAGQRSGPASAWLRFDDERPGEAAPAVGATWLGRNAFPLVVRLGRPSRVPLSGIQGYAVSISTDPSRAPCAAADRCTAAETDLHGGIEDDEWAVVDLPEGTAYVRAAAVSGSGMASPASDPVALRVDKTSPTTTLHGVPEGWTDRPVTLTATAEDGGSGMAAAAGGLQPFTAISVDGGTPVTAPGSSVSATVLGEGVHRVAHYARDLAGNVDDGAGANGVRNPPPREAPVRIDRSPPSVSFAVAQDPAAPELIRARVGDPLSGPDAGRGWIAVRRRGSGDRYEPLAALPAPAGELRARWSSEDYPDGEYEFRAVGFDRAGNAAASESRADGGAMVLSNPLKERAELLVGLAASPTGGALPPASHLTVPFGREAVLRGRLVAGSRPRSSLPVQVIERYEGGAGASRVVTATTDGSGDFSVRLPAGPSRRVSAVFAGTETLTRAGAELELAVRGEVRMRTSARTAAVGGGPLRFEGRVSAAAGTIPTEGKSVELQFRLPGLPWTEFRTIRTDRRGRFRYRYRFSDDDSRGVRFLFRAYAPAQGAWPYEPSGSRPVAVRGR